MSQATEEKTSNGLQSGGQTFSSCGESGPPYELYGTGISEAGRGWLQPVLVSLKDRSGGEVVAVVAVVVLGGIVEEFVRNRGNGFDSFALIGSLVGIAAILAITILVVFGATKTKHVTHTQEDQSKETESGVGSEGSREDGGTPG